MGDMSPAEIAKHLGPMEYVDVCTEVERKYKQRFGVISVNRSSGEKGKIVTVVVELEDKTRHTVNL